MSKRIGLVVSVAGTVALLSGCVLDLGEEETDDSGQATSPTPTTGRADSTGSAQTGPETTGEDPETSSGSTWGSGSTYFGSSTGCEGDDCPGACEAAAVHTACDDGTSDVFAAIGVGCEGEATVQTSTMGSGDAIGVRTGFGSTDTWAPREGSSYAVIGNGLVAQLDDATANCSSSIGAFDPGADLPDPIHVTDVGGDCTSDESLLGTGDCSNTIQGQFEQGVTAFDYAELRIEADVPPSITSLSYDVAFFSTEYPDFFGQSYNDMFIGWLESERWTGNISFDQQGNPISLNAGFLDFRDDKGEALPEFEGTCMAGHAGTTWLNSTAPVTPGESITLVLAVFDLSDAILDSYAFVDNFAWGCEGVDEPSTTPVG